MLSRHAWRSDLIVGVTWGMVLPAYGEAWVSQPILLDLEVPEDLAQLHWPQGVNRRLHALLDRQDRGAALTPDERQEAEGLVKLAALLSWLRVRAQRLAEHGSDTR